ncbi:MAG: PilZ domain-containing protein [Polyangiaceae bacterium]|nr:PilZ domain-containing protein [Polyangiaceae bacterium]
MNERRRDKRAPIDLPITIKVGKRPLSGSTINASFHGLSVKLDETPPIRQLVQIDVALPTGKSVTAHAMVVHAADGVIGLEFFGRSTNPDWDEFVQQQLRSPGASIAPGPSAPTQLSPGTNPKVSIPPPLPRSASVPPPMPTTPPGARPAPPIPPQPPQPPAPPQPPQAPQPPSPPTGPGPAPASPTPPPYAGPERRRAPRIHMQLELRLRTPRSIHTAQTVDVSMIGATVAVSDLQAQIGEPVIVNLIQPGTSFSFRRDGVLRRISPVEGAWAHVGVEFTPLEPVREVLFAEFMNTAYAALKGG